MIDKMSRYGNGYRCRCRYRPLLKMEEGEVGKEECGREGRQKGRRAKER